MKFLRKIKMNSIHKQADFAKQKRALTDTNMGCVCIKYAHHTTQNFQLTDDTYIQPPSSSIAEVSEYGL